MPKTSQLNFAHLLHRMQNGLSLTIGPLGELNYEMASDVNIKSKYPMMNVNVRNEFEFN